MFSVDYILSKQISIDIAEYFIIQVCKTIIDSPDVCIGAVKDMGEFLVPSILSSTLHPNYFCSRMVGFCAKPNYKTSKSSKFIDRILAEKPAKIQNNDFISKLYEEMENKEIGRKTVKILHMTDLHFDFEYVEGTNANCGKPVCCRVRDGRPAIDADKAGKYGSFWCDSPVVTIESAFAYLSSLPEAQKPDVIFWTGDNTPHDVWEQSYYANALYTEKVTEFLRTHLPGVPVFGALGNHEFYPVNVMSMDGDDESMKYLKEAWKDYMTPESFVEFGKGGFYSQKVDLPGSEWDKVRIVSVNSEQCNNMNWWLWGQMNDPQGELAWLEKTLLDAESKDEIVFLLAHIPPSSPECLHSWAIRFKSIMERFQHVVRSQYYGHTHDEFWHINTGFKDKVPNSIVFGTSSLGAREGKNPSFRIFEHDADTMLPVEIHRYTMNLTKSNLDKVPHWTLQYSATQEYGLKNLSPASLYEFTTSWGNGNVEMLKRTLINEDGRYTHQTTDQIECDEDCIKDAQCDWRSSESYEMKDCKGEEHLDFFNEPDIALFELMNDPWVEGGEF